MCKFLCGVALTALFAVITPSLSADKFPVGDWYDEGEHGSYRVLSLTHIKADGSFDAEFRECHFNPPRDHIEAGHWDMSGGHFETITESVWNKSVYLAGEYETLSNDGHVWSYQTTGGDALKIFGPIKVKMVKVTADSKMPGCDTTS